VVCGCLFTFIIMFTSNSSAAIILEEVIEEMFFILWATLQYLRIILLIQHRREANINSESIDLKQFHSDSILDDDDDVYDSKPKPKPNKVKKHNGGKRKVARRRSGDDGKLINPFSITLEAKL
jgi:hypothetical protein